MLSKEKIDAQITAWLNARSWGCKIGLVLGLLHFLFIVWNIIYMISHSDGRWHMFWILCGYIDFPVSLLLSRIILPLYVTQLGIEAPYSAGGILMFATFSAFHVLLGSAWYVYLPILLEKLIKKIATGTVGAVIIVLLVVIPIFANWLQLLRFIPRHVHIFAPGVNSVLPALWVVLLVWLYLATSRRKPVLWLLCLSPFVFYYFLHDLYYYMMLTGR
jgi:hypothetical protein